MTYITERGDLKNRGFQRLPEANYTEPVLPMYDEREPLQGEEKIVPPTVKETMMDEGENTNIHRIGYKVGGASGGGSPGDDIQSVGVANDPGTHDDLYAREDHEHEGVHSVSKLGDPQITGDATLSEGTGITLTQVGNDIEIAASSEGGGSNVEKPWGPGDYHDLHPMPNAGAIQVGIGEPDGDGGWTTEPTPLNVAMPLPHTSRFPSQRCVVNYVTPLPGVEETLGNTFVLWHNGHIEANPEQEQDGKGLFLTREDPRTGRVSIFELVMDAGGYLVTPLPEDFCLSIDTLGYLHIVFLINDSGTIEEPYTSLVDAIVHESAFLMEDSPTPQPVVLAPKWVAAPGDHWCVGTFTLSAVGYVPLTPADIGKIVTEFPLPVRAGILVGYDNTNRVWTVMADNYIVPWSPFSIGPLGIQTAGQPLPVAPSGTLVSQTRTQYTIVGNDAEWEASGISHPSVAATAPMTLWGSGYSALVFQAIVQEAIETDITDDSDPDPGEITQGKKCSRIIHAPYVYANTQLVPPQEPYRYANGYFFPATTGPADLKIVISQNENALTFEAAGFTPCVASDIGLPITDTVTGSGILIGFDNAARIMLVSILPGPGTDFTIGAVASVTGGTGTGTISSGGAIDEENAGYPTIECSTFGDGATGWMYHVAYLQHMDADEERQFTEHWGLYYAYLDPTIMVYQPPNLPLLWSACVADAPVDFYSLMAPIFDAHIDAVHGEGGDVEEVFAAPSMTVVTGVLLAADDSRLEDQVCVSVAVINLSDIVDPNQGGRIQVYHFTPDITTSAPPVIPGTPPVVAMPTVFCDDYTAALLDPIRMRNSMTYGTIIDDEPATINITRVPVYQLGVTNNMIDPTTSNCKHMLYYYAEDYVQGSLASVFLSALMNYRPYSDIQCNPDDVVGSNGQWWIRMTVNGDLQFNRIFAKVHFANYANSRPWREDDNLPWYPINIYGHGHLSIVPSFQVIDGVFTFASSYYYATIMSIKDIPRYPMSPI